MHGGEAVLESALGEGTTVTVQPALCRGERRAANAACRAAKILPFRGAGADPLESLSWTSTPRLKAGIFVRALIRRAEVAGAPPSSCARAAEEAGAVILNCPSWTAPAWC